MSNIFPEGDNPRDPLKKTGPDAQLELLRRFGKAATGFPTEVVIGASFNLLLSAIRQAYPLRSAAEARYNELFGKLKSVLLSHYDGVTGKRKSIFPFEQQLIQTARFIDDDKIHRH